MNEKITCVVAGTDYGNVTIKEIPNQLKEFQKLVDGYIEITSLPQLSEKGISMIVNEEGLIKQLEVNANLRPFFYAGNVIFISTEGEEFASLTTAQIHFLICWLTANGIYFK